MADKVVIPYEIIKSMVNRLNNKEINIASLEEETGYNRKAISRRIKEAGYIYDRASGTYSLIESNLKLHESKHNSTTTNSNKIINNNSSTIKEEAHIVENKRPVGRPKAKEELEKHTYALPKDLVKAMKRKAVEEDKTVVEVMREVLRAGIEDKYFKEY